MTLRSEGVRAVDRYTLQLRLNQPNYPVIEQNLTIALAVAREVVEAAGRDVGTRPVGTGPYRLREWKRGSRIVLEANPNYRLLKFPESSDPAHAALVRGMAGKRLPQVGVVNISIIEEMQSRLLEFEQGHLDYIELTGEICEPAADQWQTQAGIRVGGHPALSVVADLCPVHVFQPQRSRSRRHEQGACQSAPCDCAGIQRRRPRTSRLCGPSGAVGADRRAARNYS